MASQESLQDDLARLATNAVLFPAEAALIELTGADRREWLQGQITQDLRTLSLWGSVKSCLCAPTGQLQAEFTLWELEGRFLLATDPMCVSAILKRVEDMVILEDVSAQVLPFELVSIQGPTAGDHLDEGALALAMDRSGYGGFDVWDTPHPHRLPMLSAEAAEISRIEAGIPKYGIDMDARTLPPEMGSAFEGAHVSYTKGCYTGQEVLMRIHSRGHTNRTWVGLILDHPLRAGDLVEDLGTVTSACVSPRLGPIALAMVKNSAAEPGTKLRVGVSEGVVVTLPF